MGLHHSNCEIKGCGINLCLTSFIGASSDGVFSCKCHKMNALIEIKCPYSMIDSVKIEDAIEYKQVCIDASKHLKKKHRYYTQVQVQLYAYDYNECIFVVWTPRLIFQTLVSKDDGFISSALLILEKFYTNHILKELLTRNSENDPASSVDYKQKPKLYCYCQKPEDISRTWVGCDSVSCRHECLHVECLTLNCVPRGKGHWYCPTYKEEQQREIKSK